MSEVLQGFAERNTLVTSAVERPVLIEGVVETTGARIGKSACRRIVERPCHMPHAPNVGTGLQ
jgi:hypothetical protein